MKKLLLASAILAGLATSAAAQTVVQQSPTQLNAAVVCQTIVTPAINTQNTLTFPAVAGQSLYLSYLYLAAAQDATASANTNLTFTSTNLSATPSWAFSIAATANLTYVLASGSINPPIKAAAAGTAVTLVSPAAIAHTAYPMTACGYYAP